MPAVEWLFVPVREMGSRYFKTDAVYEPGKPFMGGGEVIDASDEAYGAVRALDVLTGERRWEHRLLSPLWAGVMATASGLVFGSTNEGNVFALDAGSGRPLWDFQTGGGVREQSRVVPDRRSPARRHRVRPGGVRVRPALIREAWGNRAR